MSDWNVQIQIDTSEEDGIVEQPSFVGALVGEYAIRHLCKEPRRTSEQTGHAWVQEIMQGHPIRCYEMFRMEKQVFYEICTELVEKGLKPTNRMGIEEMVGIFLNMVGHGIGNRMLQERFQHSGETISRHIHSVLAACLKLSFKYIKAEDPTFRRSHERIQNDQRYWPFFKNAIEASTAHDARVFDHALTNAHMNFPHPPLGKYSLVDAGYPTPMWYLGPYRCERYHLPDFRRKSGFTNHNEVFNFYHSSLRCTIERTFGVWKNKFAILRHMPKYKLETQVQIVCATMTLHNFIRRNAEIDVDFSRYEDENIILDMDADNYHSQATLDQSQVLNVISSVEMDRVRDSHYYNFAHFLRIFLQIFEKNL